MTLAENFTIIRDTIPENVSLIVVSKTKPIPDILEVYKLGQRDFGESKAQEMVPKHQALPRDIRWHMIGHLQTNKVKYIAPFVSMIHSVDSLKLLSTINKEAAKCNRVIDCLLQMHIAEEDTKFGLGFDEAVALLESAEYKNMNNIKITGLMCMATFTDDTLKIRREFHLLANYFNRIRDRFFAEGGAFREMSMGMSDDYPVAIEEGSTMVRIGSRIFGHR